MKHSRRLSKGFTLTELAFSIAIMSIISISVSTLLTSAYQAQQTHRITAMVEASAMNFTEQLRRDARNSVAVAVTAGFAPGVPNGAVGTTFFSDNIGATGTGRGLRFYYERDAQQVVVPNLYVEYRFFNNGPLERVSTYNPENRVATAFRVARYVGAQPDGTPDANDLVVQCVNAAGDTLQTNCLSFTNTSLYTTPNPQLPTQILAAGLTRVTVNGLRIRTAPRNGDGTINNNPNALGIVFFPIDDFGQPAYNIRQVSFELGGGKVFR